MSMTDYRLQAQRPISEKLGASIWPYFAEDKVELMMKAAAKMGLKYTNLNQWLDPNSNFDYNSSSLTSAFDLAKKYNLGIVSCFGTSNGKSLNSDTQSYWTADQLAQIKGQCVKSIIEFAGRNIIYLPWNEPNNSYWAPQNTYDTIESNCNMQKYIATQAKKFDSSALVAGPSIIWPLNYLEINKQFMKAFLNQGFFKQADAVCEHPYVPQSENSGHPEQLIKYDQNTFVGLPRITNEFGFPWSQTSNHTDSTFQGIWSKRDAIKFTLRQILILDYLNYSIIGLYTEDVQADDYNLIDPDSGELNSAGNAIKWLIDELNGYTFDSKIEITEHVGYVDDLYLMKYTKDGANDKLVYWTPSRIGELYGLVYQNNFYKFKFSDYPQILEVN